MLISKRLLSLVLALLMIVGMFMILSIPVLAEDDLIIATLKDDSGNEVDFGGANDNATIGYNGTAEKDYNMKVILSYPSEASGKSATITLAQGLKFSDDGSADPQVSGMMDGFVTNTPNDAPFGLSADMSDTGGKAYRFIDGLQTVTLNLTIRADSRFWHGSIADAITIDSTHNGSAQSQVVLETLTVSCPTRTPHTGSGSYNGYTITDSDIDIGPNYKTFFTSLTSAWTLCPVFYKDFVATITIDSRVIVTNTDTQNWAMANNGDSNGTTTYTFTYNYSAPGLLDASLSVPVVFKFPSGYFSAGDTITGTRSATATLAGGNYVNGETSATWPVCNLIFTVAASSVDLFVNHETVTKAAAAAKNNTPMGVDATASSGSTSPTLSGMIGWYSIGNSGGFNSGPQIVEMNFDKEKLGILGVALAIPTGQTVTEIKYKTVNNPGNWQSKSVNLTGPSGQYVYVSWKGLGITENPMESGNYITAIRYALDSIPGASIIGMRDSSTVRTPIYGVTLSAGEGETAISTVSLYAPAYADNPENWITGTILSDHSDSYVSPGFESVAGAPGHTVSVSKLGGETFSFTQKITPLPQNYVSNAARNNAAEHPTLYLRSVTGNPITNIKLVNNRDKDITEYLKISSELIDGVLVYTIDTSDVPGDGAAIAHSAVLSDGNTKSPLNITLSYDIATKLTDSGGPYKYADMLFVETPKTTQTPGTENYARRWIGPSSPYPGVGKGDGYIIWGMPTGVSAGYTITGRKDITVSLSAKQGEDGAYTTWTEGAAPCTIDAGSSSAMDIRLDVVNNSGVAVGKETIIYLPIPKVGNNWNNLMHNADAFEFSMVLKSEISLPTGINGLVSYGNVTPTDDGATLNSYNFTAWDESAAASYNCVKITLNSLPNSTAPIRLDVQMTVDSATPGLTEGLVNVWRPCYYEDLTNSSNDVFKKWEKGSYLAAQTAISGTYNIIYENLNGASNDNNPASYTYGTGLISLADPGSREGYVFSGWYDAETGGSRITLISDTHIGDITLYARWTREAHYIINGTVQDDDGNLLEGVYVYITRGGDIVADDTTVANGKFSLNQIPPGTYNLVAEYTDNSEETIVTQILNIPDNLTGDIVIIMPIAQGRKSSVFVHDKTVNVDAVGGLHDVYDAAGANPAGTDADGITEADLQVYGSGGEITIYLEAKEPDTTNAHTTEAIAAVADEAHGNNKKIGFELDLSAYKTVINGAGTTIVECQLDELNGIVTVYISLPGELQDREGYVVYRRHGSQVDTITQDDTLPEYFEISPDGKTIILHVYKFSVYAIAVNPIISFNPNSGTGTMPDIHVSDGRYTLPACSFTRDGYSFSGWNTKADGSGYSYINKAALSGITADIILYAQWMVNKSTPPSSSGGGGGSSLIVTTQTNGNVAVDTANPPFGAKVTITARPDAGYELDSLNITDENGNKISYTDNGDGTYTFTMPGATATIAAIFREIDGLDQDIGAYGLLNTDDHFAYIQGRPGNLFAAQCNMTRAEAAQMFNNLLRNKNVITDDIKFPDVQEDAWYATAVNTLASLGIIEGLPDGNYYPDDPITRAQFTAIVVRFAKVSPTGAIFDDVPAVHWAYDYINTAADLNWIEGVGNDLFAPDRNITRAEAVTLVNRMLRRYPDKAYIDSCPDLIHFADEDLEFWAYYEIMEAVNTHEYITDSEQEIWK